MGWQDQYDDLTFEAAEPGAVWVDFLAVAIGAGAMLLMLHLLGALTSIERWAALL